MKLKNIGAASKSSLWSIIPVILVSLYGVASFYGLSSLLNTQQWVSHTQKVIAAASEIEKLVVDLETGERGFLITGKEAFLEPYHEARKKLSVKISDTKILVKDNPQQVQKINQIETQIENWLSQAAKVEINIRKQVADGTVDAEQLQRLLREGKGKNILDGIRKNLNTLDAMFTKAGNQKARTLVMSIAKDMVDQETGQRGFLITGEQNFLEPFQQGQLNLNKHVEQLHALVDSAYDRQMMLNDIEQLKSLTLMWRQQTAQPEIALRQKVNSGTEPFSKLSKILSQAKGKNTLDQLRKKTNSMSRRFERADNQLAKNYLLSISKDMLDQETGQRGFLITGKESFLKPYHDGITSLQKHFTFLKTIVESAYGIHHARRLINQVSTSAITWKEKAGEPEISLRTEMNKHGTSIKDVVTLIEKQTGKQIMDQLRVLLIAFKRVESQLMAQREARADATAQISLWISIIGALIIIAFAIVLIRVASSLRRNTQTLELERGKLEGQDWVKSQFAAITAKLSGLKDLQLFADTLMNEMVPMVDAHLGLFYQGKTDIDEKTYLSLLGSYAYQKRKNLSNRFDLGEGLVGQSALEKKAILLENVPQDYIYISSGSGQVRPGNIIVFPILFEGQLLAVIEIASNQKFNKLQRELMAQLEHNIGVIFNNLLSGLHTNQLLKQSQSQGELLQAQQEELKTANEDLLEQTNLLKCSEEELKQQSEELKASNEELEEKQLALQQQKDRVEATKQEVEFKAQELALASQYKSEFLANMSHELRTPLNSLLLLSKSLADNKKGNLTEEQVEDACVIYDGGNDLLSLINDIMDLSKVEAGMLDVHIEQLNFQNLSGNLKKIFNPVAANGDLEFKINIAESLPESIISDSQRVQQILKNLLSNAMKFTERGTVTLSVSTPELTTQFKQPHLKVESAIAFAVTDTGVGIAQDKQNAIFEAFQQQDGSTSRQYGGTGLGLTISRELARLLGGEIQLESKQHQGSTFTLYLPKELNRDWVQKIRAQASEQKPNSATNEAVVTNVQSVPVINQTQQRPIQTAIPDQFIGDDRRDIDSTDKTLLIIDDDKVFAKILRDHAQRNDYKCLVAGDGRSGLLLATQFQPSGILLDIGLPDIDGHHVLEQLKFNLRTRHIPVQIISGHDQAHTKSLNQGALGFLMKPVREEQLNSVLDDIADIAKSDARKILIVEDDKGSQRAVAGLLRDSASSIKCVGRGLEAIDEIINQHYDCVILDICLPDMSGFEVLKQVNAQHSSALPPIIIYTGKELSDEENSQLEKYTATIVVKGVGSPERLLDEASLFMHSIESRLQNGTQKTIRMLHDEDAMLKGRRILLVDDDMRNTYALSKKLMELGLDVEMAKHGLEAVEQLEIDGDFELVLMDIMMPVMDGYEATRRIRKMDTYKNIPIVALTAKAMQEDREKCLEAGASEYLMKPIDFDKLLSIMRIWLFKHT